MKNRSIVLGPSLVLAALALSGCGGDIAGSGSAHSEALGPAPTAGSKPKLGTGGAAAGGGSAPAVTLATLSIGEPRHGAALYDTSPWFDPATNRIRVRGSIRDLPAGLNPANLALLIDGQYMGSMVPNAATGEVGFSGNTLALMMPEWVGRGVLVELVDTVADRVIARDLVTYYDLRGTPSATPSEDPKLVIDGMAAQLTDTGIGHTSTPGELSSLEVPHRASLPEPSLADFNAELEAAARALPRYDEDDQKLGACINFAEAVELEPELDSLGAYRTAFAEAVAFKLAYDTYQEQGSAACMSIVGSLAGVSFGAALLLSFACDAAMAGWCVKDDPRPEDFELCVDQIEGEATSLAIGGVSDLDLEFGETPIGQDHARITSNLELGRIDGRLDGYLRSLSVRWENSGCAPRPSRDVQDEDIVETAWLAEFTTCRDIRIQAPSATTFDGDHPARFAVRPGSDRERVSVVQTSDPEFAFVDPEISAKKQLCAEEFLSEHAEGMAATFEASFEDALNDTWNAGGQQTHQADALELLLSRLELGIPEHPDHTVSAKHEPIRSHVLAGAKFTLKTLVEPVAAEVWDRQTFGFFHHPAQDAPYQPDGKDILGAPFDLSFTVTTGHLNQILHVLGATDRIHFDYQPTWAELARFGVTPASTGYSSASVPPLNGAVLGQLHSMFAGLGARQVRIHVRPTLDPVAWMNPDPPGFMGDPLTGAPLAYGIGGLEIRFAEPDVEDPVTKEIVPGYEWLRLAVSFFDDDFSLSLGQPGSNVLRAAYTSDDWGLSVERNALPGCPPVPHGLLEPPSSCERDLEGLLLSLFEPLLRPIFLGMLSEIEAPQFWNAADATRQPVHAVQTARWQMHQNVTLFADIPDTRP